MHILVSSLKVWSSLRNKSFYELHVCHSPIRLCNHLWSSASFVVRWSLTLQSVLNYTGTIQRWKIFSIVSFTPLAIFMEHVLDSFRLIDVTKSLFLIWTSLSSSRLVYINILLYYSIIISIANCVLAKPPIPCMKSSIIDLIHQPQLHIITWQASHP